MLRRVAAALNARVRNTEPESQCDRVADEPAAYKVPCNMRGAR